MGLSILMDLSVPVTDEVKLNVRHWPGAGSRAFLLVHGLLSNARSWDEVAERLAAEGHPVYAVDLRGHGESDTPDDGYDTGAAVTDLVALSEALGLTGSLVAGHSWGAYIALRLAAEHPALVAGLALVDGGWIDTSATVFDAFARNAEREVMAERARAVTATEMRAYLRGAHPNWSHGAVEAYLANMRIGPDGSLTPRLSTTQFMSVVRSMREESPTRWHSSVTVPVAILLPAVAGVDPEWTRRFTAWVESAKEALSRGTVKWYPDNDHYLQCAQPELLARDLLDLAGAAGSPGEAR